MKEKTLTIAALRARIRNPSKRYQGIHQFRAGVDVNHFVPSYQKFFPHKASLEDFHGTPFPKHASQLFKTRTPKSRVSAIREILWSISRCLQFSSELKNFISRQERYQIAILENDFDSAIDHLRHIENDFGKSIWLYQNLIACAYTSTNDSEPSDAATSVLEEVKCNGVLHALLHFSRIRIEGATLREKLRAEIIDHISQSGYESYFLAKLLDATDSSELAVSSLLFFDAQASVIDHYTSLLLALQAAVSAQMIESSLFSLIKHPLKQLFKLMGDNRFIGILAALGDLIDADSIMHDTERAHAIESYTTGNYEQCIILSNKVLLADPLDIAIRVLNNKAAVAIERRPENTGGICGNLNDSLFNLLSANDQFFRSAYALLQTTDRFFDHNWAQYLRVAVWHELGSEEPKRSQSWMRDMYVRDRYITPFMAIAMDDEHSENIVCHLEAKGKFPQTVNLVREILDCRESNRETISPRYAKYRAREFLVRKQYGLAAESYMVAATKTPQAAVRLRALGGASLAFMLDGQYKVAVETLLAAYLDCTHAPTILPFKELADRLHDSDSWPNTISLGLLFSMAVQFDGNDDLGKLRLSFERFCEMNSIDSATQLVNRSDEFGIKHVIAYLDQVWQPEVMRQTLLYTTPSEIEEARIEACQLLARIDPQRARIHKEELASRIKQQEISKATTLVEQSKVYVDIDAIKRSLRSRLKSSYAQYKSAIAQYDKPQSDILLKLQSVFDGMDKTTSLPTILSTLHLIDGQGLETQSDVQFSAIFQEITKEFLTGDHGLNAYLSTRVRHGKLVDALRKSVMDEHLVTARQDDGSYVDNIHWLEELPTVGDHTLAMNALVRFSFRFDETLFCARDKKIQIRTYLDMKATDENSEGLFLYQFSNLERRLMQSYDVEFKDFDELVEKCVDSLWEKTDLNLAEVRKYVDGTLRNEILSHFDALTAELSHIYCGGTPSRLANAIARSRTATQQALENVATWFKRSEVYDRQDFDIEFPSQISASMVNRTLSMPTPWSGPECQIEIADAKLPGRALDSLVDIFYTLFENAAKYAEVESIPLRVKLNLCYQGGAFHCEARSEGKPPSSERLAMLRELKSSLDSKESRRLAQSEGRSGFRKILLALSNPIYRVPSLDFMHETDGMFVVRFGFKISEQS